MVAVRAGVLAIFAAGVMCAGAAAENVELPAKYCGGLQPGRSKFYFRVPAETTLAQCDAMVQQELWPMASYRSVPMCLGKDMVMRTGKHGGSSGEPGAPPVPNECDWR